MDKIAQNLLEIYIIYIYIHTDTYIIKILYIIKIHIQYTVNVYLCIYIYV